MPGQSTHSKRRFGIGSFHNRFFVGRGLDVGGGSDSLNINAHAFALIKSVEIWDTWQGDAQYLATLADNTYDFLHSSHTLEHLHDPRIGLGNWIRVVKPGGHLVVTVPDEDLYEKGVWPSRFNVDHKGTFTIFKPASWNQGHSINILDLCTYFAAQVEVEKIELIRDFFNERTPHQFDQTEKTITAECSIEFVLRKRLPRS